MSALTVLSFIIPGFFAEFLLETYERIKKHCCDENKLTFLYKFLRGLAFNLPMTIIVWFFIWLWRYVLHYAPIPNFATFWNSAINGQMMFHYWLVLLAELVLFKIFLKILLLINKKKTIA